jgi:DNA polymerase III sliding clamp (beta) subunit (PCNA family)
MAEGFKSGNELLPEFLPTETRFFAIADTKALRIVVGRLAAISATNSLKYGTDLLRIGSVEPTSVTSGMLHLYATNGSIFMDSSVTGVAVKGDGQITVPAQRLIDVLKLAKGEKVTLSCIGFELQVSSENSLWRIQLPAKEDMPEYQRTEGFDFEVSAPELTRILSGVVKAAAGNNSRDSLMQIRMGDGNAISCDGSRMHRVTSSELDGVRLFTLPTIGAKLFLRLIELLKIDSEVSITVTDTAVELYSGMDSIKILRSKMGFPDVERVFISQSVLSDTIANVNRSALQDAVTQVRVFADEVLSGVSLTSTTKAGGKTFIMVHAKDDIGNYSATEVPASIEGKAVVDLKVNYKQLQEALDSAQSDIVSIRVAKSSKSKKTSAFIEDLEHGFVAVLGQIIKEN